ncbi:MAG: hypothetical protein AAGD35_11185 [Actinomycetota bacterium]
MREFSLFHGRFRQLPLIAAMLLVAAVYIYLERSGSPTEEDCPEPAEIAAASPTSSVNVGECGSDEPGVEPVVIRSDDDPFARTTTTADWSKATGDGDVPIISLRPSPNSLTDAGQDLVEESGG